MKSIIGKVFISSDKDLNIPSNEYQLGEWLWAKNPRTGVKERIGRVEHKEPSSEFGYIEVILMNTKIYLTCFTKDLINDVLSHYHEKGLIEIKL